MKTLFTRARLLTALLLLAVASATIAQPLNPEAVAFTKTYQDAYNKGDRSKLMTLFADNVGWVNADASVKTYPKAEVDADFVRDFGETAGSYMEFTVVSTEARPDGTMKIGTTVTGYDFLRKTNAKLNPTAGTYEMLIGKVGGQWKISQVNWNMNTVALEIRDFVKQFQAAFNREDAATLKTMFTADAVRTATDGTTTKGAAIIDFYTQGFADADVTNIVSLANVSPQFDGSVIFTGTYHLTGWSVKGERIAREGAYSNTAINENGQWKISRNTQSKLVKTVIYHKVADYAAWRKGFDLLYNERRLAGELSAEVGTLQDDPSTVYVIGEWASPDAPKAFFASPELAAAMQKQGVVGKPTVLIMSKK